MDKVIPEYWIQSQFLLNDYHVFKSIKYATLLFVWYMTVKMTQIFWFVKYWLGQTLFSNSVSWCFLNAVNFYHLIKIPFWMIIYVVRNICHIFNVFSFGCSNFNFICFCLHQHSTITKPYMFWLDMLVMQIPRKIFYLLCLLCSVWWD